MKTIPLNYIKIASPCSADWDEMRGDNRKRYCSQCKLNVYNLSEMPRTEAEKLLFQIEGKMCVRLYKRSDGTVITQDCPVGLVKLKQKVSQALTAVFSLIVGFLGGMFGLSQLSFDNSKLLEEVAVESKDLTEIKTGILIEEGGLSYEKPNVVMGGVQRIKRETKKKNDFQTVVGRVDNFRPLEDEPVELWIK